MTSKQRHQQGHLTVGVSSDSGRKIDTWTFRPGDIAGKRDRDQEIVFEVSMLKSLEFLVNTKHIPAERWKPLRGAVLSNLHEQALEAARAEFDLKSGLVWSDWLEIMVQEPDFHDARKSDNIAQASLFYRQVARAESPDGKAYTVNGNGLLTRFPEPTQVYRDVDGNMMNSRRPSAAMEERARATTREGSAARLSALLNATDSRPANTQFTYLPDTPENRAGLDAIIAAINEVNQRLQQFLHPDAINDTLQRALAAGGHRLLGGPSANTSIKGAKP